MKKLTLFFVLLIMSACGSDGDVSDRSDLLYGVTSPITITCADISNSSSKCAIPAMAFDQANQLYYPLFPSTSFNAMPPATLWFTVDNTSTEIFSGSSEADVYYSSSASSYVVQSFLVSVNLAPSSSQTFSFLLSTPTPSDAYGDLHITIKNSYGILENKAIMHFSILH